LQFVGRLDTFASSSPIAQIMSDRSPSARIALPSVDLVLRQDESAGLVRRYGRTPVVAAIRDELAACRSVLRQNGAAPQPGIPQLLVLVKRRLAERAVPPLRRVFNLTGTVLHTNLGRAVLPREAIDAVIAVAGGPSNLEYDLATGKRGDRDTHLEEALCRLTGAEAATVVNNNAAAVLLVLNTLAARKEVPTSRGELIEIGGSFRMPDIMSRAGCRLREVGTTNRTHLADFATAIGPRTGLVMKVHTSNYVVEGFTAAVPEAELAQLCKERGVPFVVDLGSGALVDLRAFGLPHEPTPAETLASGADLVTFSGDKLLGGPQAGIIVGRADLVARIKRNPLKRALRVDKMTIAALAAVLGLAADPERLREHLPALRALTRPLDDIRRTAARLGVALAPILKEYAVDVVDCASEIGSGAQPGRDVPSAGVAMTPRAAKGRGGALLRLAGAFRALPVPVIGRIQDDAYLLDCRCLLDAEDTETFLTQLGSLVPAGRQ
jgi:L-seryl-tRNA(Ser) seleniumtransferase